MKHTPGPWNAKHEVNDVGYPWIVRSKWNGKGYCELAVTLNGKGNNETNARLIASSPTMYEYIKNQAKKGCKDAQTIISTIE